MKSFKECITEEQLLEKTVSFGSPNPKEQVVIMLGGAASGKSFLIDHGLQIDAKYINIDSIREYVPNSDFWKDVKVEG